MKILRTIFWVLAAIGFLIFAIYNWQPVELTLWQNLVLETKVPVLALVAFLAGFLPMWALHRSVVWGLNRRIRALETPLKNTTIVRQREFDSATPLIASPVNSPASTTVGKTVEKSGKNAGERADDGSSSDPAGFGSSDAGGGK